jgi:hypothetical protein
MLTRIRIILPVIALFVGLSPSTPASSQPQSYSAIIQEGRIAVLDDRNDEAIRLLLPLAAERNPEAQYLVGYAYSRKARDKEGSAEYPELIRLAMKWYFRAADNGHDRAAQSYVNHYGYIAADSWVDGVRAGLSKDVEQMLAAKEDIQTGVQACDLRDAAISRFAMESSRDLAQECKSLRLWATRMPAGECVDHARFYRDRGQLRFQVNNSCEYDVDVLVRFTSSTGEVRNFATIVEPEMIATHGLPNQTWSAKLSTCFIPRLSRPVIENDQARCLIEE